MEERLFGWRIALDVAPVSVQPGNPAGVQAAEPGVRRRDQEAIVKNYAVIDANAFGLCKANQLPIVVFNINQPGAISRVLRGDRVGTLVR